MRHTILAFLMLPVVVMAAESPDKPATKRAATQADFEKQFLAADTDGNGTLSRAEMKAKFKRTDEVFDRIDTNMDGQISLSEVKVAVEKSVEAAMQAGGARKYGKSIGSSAGLSGEKSVEPEFEFADESEEREHHGYKFYDSLISSEHRALERGEKVKPEPVPNVLQKSF